MDTIRKTKLKIGTKDKPPYIPKEMPRSQARSTRLNIETTG